MARRKPPARLLGSGLIPANFGSRAINIESDYGNAMTRFADSERNLFRDTGFTGQIDPTSGAVNYAIDPSATFGAYQQGLRALAEQLVGARSQAVERGIGKGGLAAQRARLARFAASQQQSQMLTGFQTAATGIFRGRGEALSTKNRLTDDLEGEALEWWNQYGPEDEGAADPAPTRPGAGGHNQPGLWQQPGQEPGDELLHGYSPYGTPRRNLRATVRSAAPPRGYGREPW